MPASLQLVEPVVTAEHRVRDEIAEQLRVGPARRLAEAGETVAAAQAELADDRDRTLALVASARDELSAGIDELQRLARGIYPAQLPERGAVPVLSSVADRTRRTIERDLHDGAQQRFVSLSVTLQLAERLLERGAEHEGASVLQEVVDGLDAALHELALIAGGHEPHALRHRGLTSALEELVGRSPIDVALDVAMPPMLAPALAGATYFFVSEALTNALKHARARHACVHVGSRGRVLEVVVSDDGRGGADATAGSGLRGLSDRVERLGGRLEVDSSAGAGTTLTALLPLAG